MDTSEHDELMERYRQVSRRYYVESFQTNEFFDRMAAEGVTPERYQDQMASCWAFLERFDDKTIYAALDADGSLPEELRGTPPFA